MLAAGRPETGFQVVDSNDGRLIGPPLGVRSADQEQDYLTFSQDEQVLLLGSTGSMPRIWSVPVAGLTANVAQQSSTHTIWSPAADRPLIAAPDGKFVAIGDPAGHVHIIPSEATLADVANISEDLSFVGHNSAVTLLGVAPSGSLAASMAADNTLRVWRTNSGEPLPYIVEIVGPPVSHISFSPDALFLGLLSGTRVSVIDVADGSIVADYDAGHRYSGLTFAAEDHLYLGGQDGALQLFSRGDDKSWHMRQVWQGPAGIRTLRASPKGNLLVLVDQNNLASQFFLADGRMGDGTLQFPAKVQEVVFDRNGTHVYFRTARWVHQASSSVAGLTWMDALFVPRALNGAGIVQGNGAASPVSKRRMYLPVASNGYIEFVEWSVKRSGAAPLFGNKQELLREWRDRISVIPREGS